MQVLCLQLQRVRWSNLGSPEKLHGHVAFPLSIDLSPCLAAAAKPLLGETPPEPAEREKGLTQAPQLFTDQETSMREEQQKAQLPGGSGIHSCRGESPCDSEEAHCRINPSGSAYRLVAVIVHHGSPRSGHYTTYRSVLRVPERRSDEQWVCVSDEDVRDADVREVLACQASMLFYERMHR